MAEKKKHNPDKSSSADVSRVSRSRDQDGHHTHICPLITALSFSIWNVDQICLVCSKGKTFSQSERMQIYSS